MPPLQESLLGQEGAEEMTFCEDAGITEEEWLRAKERIADLARLAKLEYAPLPPIERVQTWQGLYGGNEAYLKRIYSPAERMIILEELTARAYEGRREGTPETTQVAKPLTPPRRRAEPPTPSQESIDIKSADESDINP